MLRRRGWGAAEVADRIGRVATTVRLLCPVILLTRTYSSLYYWNPCSLLKLDGAGISGLASWFVYKEKAVTGFSFVLSLTSQNSVRKGDRFPGPVKYMNNECEYMYFLYGITIPLL